MLDQQEKTDLIALAGRCADAEISRRSHELLASSIEASQYYADMAVLVGHLESAYREPLGDATTPRMTRERAVELARAVESRARIVPLWPRRTAIAAAIALFLLPTFLVGWLAVSRRPVGTLTLVRTGGNLATYYGEEVRPLRKFGDVQTEDGFAVIQLRDGRHAFLGPSSRVHVGETSWKLESGQLFIESSRELVELRGLKMVCKGEALFRQEPDHGWVSVYAGEVEAMGPMGTMVIGPKRAVRFLPDAATEDNYTDMFLWWVKKGRHLLQQQSQLPQP